jgi:branched-subunit amino acid ABC-type transport system permease component
MQGTRAGAREGAFDGRTTVRFAPPSTEPSIQNLTVFVIFIVVLVLRPQGLFTRRARA